MHSLSKVLCPALLSIVAGLLSPSQTALASTPVFALQGSGDTSPFAGRNVTTEGVVTGSFQGRQQLNGFYIQDARGDNNPATSDGLFIYAGGRSPVANVDVKPGDLVQVSGRVTEFKGQTQLERLTEIRVIEESAPPAPVELRLPVKDDTDLERLEGMLVTCPQPLIVSGNHNLGRYGELMLSAEDRLWVTSEEKQQDEQARLKSPAIKGRRIILDDGSTMSPPRPVPYLDDSGTRRVGDRVHGLTGILGYAFDEYRLWPTRKPEIELVNARPEKPEAVGGDLRIATFNVHNYFTTLKSQNSKARGAETAEEFALQSGKVVTALHRLNADVVGLVEMENNGSLALTDLVTRLNAAYSRNTDDHYDFVRDPAATLGTDMIKVAFIYKPARIELVGTAISDAATVFDRPPLAQTFRARRDAGEPFTIIVNHFKSKGGCPAQGDVDTGQGCWNQRRTQQAQALQDFVRHLQGMEKRDVLVMGDLNAYDGEDPVQLLQKSGLTNLSRQVPEKQRYSYVYDGRSGSLDHVLATPGLARRVTGITKWHINADEPPFLQVGDRNALPLASQPNAAANPFRSSDHDPVLLGLRSSM
jgi:predicted extracellular nuclease